MTQALRLVVSAAMLLLAFAHSSPAAAQDFRDGRTASRVAASTTDRYIVVNDRIAAVQGRLALLGYDPGPSDGIMGPRTHAAIRAFQRATGLPEDGRFSERLEKEVSRAHLAVAGSRETGPAPGTMLLVALALAAILLLFRSRPKRRRRQPTSAAASAPHRRAPSLQPEIGSLIAGKAYVTDGDGIRVSRHTIRFAALDAPEWDQWAKHRDGYWFKHGKRVKSALIETIGGRPVHVTVEGYDKYDRVIGTVTCDDKDVGAWLVRNGHAIAAYGDRYKGVEREARQEKRGLWGHDIAFDPRYWRRRQAGRG